MAIEQLFPGDPRFPKGVVDKPDRVKLAQIAAHDTKSPTDTYVKEKISVVGAKAATELTLHMPLHPHPKTGANEPNFVFCRPLDNVAIFRTMRPGDWDRLADDALTQYAAEHGCNVALGPTGEWQLQRSRMVQLEWPVKSDE
jgi:hypothetical protein